MDQDLHDGDPGAHLRGDGDHAHTWTDRRVIQQPET